MAEWFAEYQAQVWDERIGRDVQGGHLDASIEEAEREFGQGRCEPL